MRAALAAHDELLRAAIEAHSGFLFKHTGDGVCAAFASPRKRGPRRRVRFQAHRSTV
jgi:class 3 adenylate cyclase